jgi:hypothetical protein
MFSQNASLSGAKIESGFEEHALSLRMVKADLAEGYSQSSIHLITSRPTGLAVWDVRETVRTRRTTAALTKAMKGVKIGSFLRTAADEKTRSHEDETLMTRDGNDDKEEESEKRSQEHE